ncbi:MAG: hypothetical protein JXR37_19130 [Kiritimatiellae bacterium]|nr:hypothetical protein [Kiritimatiellia bacterium]
MRVSLVRDLAAVAAALMLGAIVTPARCSGQNANPWATPTRYADLVYGREGRRNRLITTLPGDIPADNAPAQAGYLDVTLYGADPTGRADATAAIQKAVDTAYRHHLVCFFPAGEYLVSDTITGMRHVYSNTNYRADGPKRKDGGHPEGRGPHRSAHGPWGHMLIGSTRGKRPLLRLAPSAPGFADPQAPKPVVRIFSQGDGRPYLGPGGSDNPKHQQGDISFNQIFRGIDISTGGNPGAIGIAHWSCQGSLIENTAIDARGSFAGVSSPPGYGGYSADIEVRGGRYGIHLAQQTFNSMLAGVRLIGQDEAAIYSRAGWGTAVVGFHIVKDSGVAIDTGRGIWGDGRGSMMLYDGIIEMRAGETAFRNAERCTAYLRNVYVKGAATLVESGAESEAGGAGWLRIREYAVNAENSLSRIDGRPTPKTVFQSEKAEPPPDLVARHVFRPPSFEDPDAVNLRALGAKGDGTTDDTAVFEAAIARHQKIFVPKGTYVIRRTLELGPRTTLFGVALQRSVIQPDSAVWKAPTEQTLVRTANEAGARTVLSGLTLAAPIAAGEGAWNCLHWRAGRASVVHAVSIKPIGWIPKGAAAPAHDCRSVLVSHHGGGRWYGVQTLGEHQRSSHPAYRVFLAHGTREPLTIYMHDIERVAVDPMSELRDARNVRIFNTTTEHKPYSVRVVNSKNIFFGVYQADNQAVHLVDSDDVCIGCATPSRFSGRRRRPGSLCLIREDYAGQHFEHDSHAAVCKRGELDDAAMWSEGR